MGRDTGRRGDTRRETGEDIVHSGELEGPFLIFSRMTDTTTTGGRETATTKTGGGTTGTILYCTVLYGTVRTVRFYEEILECCNCRYYEERDRYESRYPPPPPTSYGKRPRPRSPSPYERETRSRREYRRVP